MAKTKIEWADRVWNPVTGCTKVSEGCRNCYAERMAKRLAGRCGYPPAPDHFKVTWHPDRLEEPLHVKQQCKIFVCSMADLFHIDVTDTMRDMVFKIIRLCSERVFAHKFIILTKRASIMYNYLKDKPVLPNVWLGVSVENQETADVRIPWLLQTPAVVRFVSCEPLLNEVDLYDYLHRIGEGKGHDYNPGIHWVIAGCESGPGRRPAKRDWFRSLCDQCLVTGVPFFLKQMQENGAVDKHPVLDFQEWHAFPKMRR